MLSSFVAQPYLFSDTTSKLCGISAAFFGIAAALFFITIALFFITTAFFVIPTLFFVIPTAFFVIPTAFFVITIAFFVIPTAFFTAFFIQLQKFGHFTVKISCVKISLYIILVKQNQVTKLQIGTDSLDCSFLKGAAHFADCLKTRRRAHDDFCNHRIIKRTDLAAAVSRRVNSCSVPSGKMQEADLPGAGAELCRRIFSIDATLDRVSLKTNILLLRRTAEALR